MSTLLLPQHGDLPHAEPTAVSKPFWDRCRTGVLSFQRCASCRAISSPPTEACRACLGTELRWEPSSGRGTVYSWTVVWRPVTPAFDVPYAPVIVDVEEGYQMISNLVGVAPGRIEVGMPVEVEFHETGQELTLPYFRPAQPAASA